MTYSEEKTVDWMDSLFTKALSDDRLTVALLRDWLKFERTRHDRGDISDALFSAYESLVQEYEAVLS